MSRRGFVLGGAGMLAGLPGCGRLPWRSVVPEVSRPGMEAGHMLRDAGAIPAPSGEVRAGTVILGSGIAALSAAWKLARAGRKDFLVLSGPEFSGNAAGGRFGDLPYPCGAHYLPLPSLESSHVREMLADLGVILRGAQTARPYFDERCIVHAPDERLYFRGSWQDGFMPSQGLSPEEAQEHKHFLDLVQDLKTRRGNDGRKLFAVPVALSSRDPAWTALDGKTFRTWLLEQGYRSATLHWYLDYVCRDEYGARHDKISAWAGLHYFASRGGQAENASDGAVLTWPDGLQALARGLKERILQVHPAAFMDGMAMRLDETAGGVEVLCLQAEGASRRALRIRADRAISAMPLFVASRIADLRRFGFDARDHLPSYAPWTVANFLMDGFPPEDAGVPLAWDNVVYQGRGLGYVVSTHQDLRVAMPPKTVFSAYHALSARDPAQVRDWLAKCGTEELFEEVAGDLQQVYGWQLRRFIEAVSITVRGHAMASPLPGYLSNRGLQALRETDGRVLFAHADLSGYSVFEEAAWWGVRAAERILG
ncbi:NAD(P)-binding protein [Noviherbaspirillum galbum]|uniref:NAD(P)-binding protein n=1 Tax=Noviherbaspirillum galbum TaxID=2709383 RepID=A0A6B3SRA5_9BURK|nr:NAD(P)-binding protein [Noviherbaspirillum galbum]